MQETRTQVLNALADATVTGPELAERLGISRAAVWKHIERLRESGFEIASTEQGYELESIPEFGGMAVEFGLDAPFEVEYHDSIGSTNARARELAGEGKANMAVVADKQTGGRGRLDREWVSPSGGIWLSLLVRPNIPPVRAPLYTLIAAVATARAARECGAAATIKWPNDVRVGEQKLAGILTEMEGEADRVSWIAVGIGLNANVDPADLPGDQPATSLKNEVGAIDRRVATQRIIEEFWNVSNSDETEILDAWRDLSDTLGKRVRIETPSGEIVGDAVDITSPGTLVVETADGVVEVTAGDCDHLRPME